MKAVSSVCSIRALSGEKAGAYMVTGNFGENGSQSDKIFDTHKSPAENRQAAIDFCLVKAEANLNAID